MKIIIAVPTYNEELILADNVLKLTTFCKNNLDIDWQVVIADNNSTDKTAEIGKELAQKFSEVDYLFIRQQGKGIAIKTAWQSFVADIYCFLDADLATDLSALPNLINKIKSGSDVVIGSRFHKDSKVSRTLLRKIFSNGYRLVLKVIIKTKINDAPCGFKAINSKVKEQVLPKVQNQEWFFDSELIILAEKAGFKISEIPVAWQDLRVNDNKSKVNVLSVSSAYFKQLLSLRKRLSKK